MTGKLRPIAAIPLGKITVCRPEGPRPHLVWVAPTALFVDELYQRSLSKESHRLIKKLAVSFAWERMKPPVVVDAGEGTLHIIDGQHTAIAAASIGLEEIPVFVVSAPSSTSRALAFVGHNTDRVRVTPLTVYQALVAAEDPDALDVVNVCRRAGVRIRNFNNASVIAEGDTMAIGTIRQVIKRRGVRKSRVILEVLKNAQRAPISGHEIVAVEKILCETRVDCDAAALAAVICAGGNTGFLNARTRATRERRTVRDVLVEAWLAAIDRKGDAA